MAEWSKVLVLKTNVIILPWVQIPLYPLMRKGLEPLIYGV